DGLHRAAAERGVDAGSGGLRPCEEDRQGEGEATEVEDGSLVTTRRSAGGTDPDPRQLAPTDRIEVGVSRRPWQIALDRRSQGRESLGRVEASGPGRRDRRRQLPDAP